MKALIIDNEEPIREAMVALVTAFCPEITHLQTADGVKTGVDKIRQFQPDILFLDVELDDGTGFDILNQISPPQFQLIFTTAHDRYAINAFQFSALDYLLKPIDPDLLAKKCTKSDSKHPKSRFAKAVASDDVATVFKKRNGQKDCIERQQLDVFCQN